MEIEHKHSVVLRLTGAAVMIAGFLAWLVPVFMLPFTNVLPYIQTMPLGHRVGISAVFYLLVVVVAHRAMEPQQRRQDRGRTVSMSKDALGVGLGAMMAIYAAAALSGNTLGLLVRAIPGNEVTREFVVVESKRSGSSFKSTKLELSSLSDSRFYEVILSKRVFGEIPRISPGDRVKFEAVENIFGTYVNHFVIVERGAQGQNPS